MVTLSLSGQTSAFRSMSSSQTFFIAQSHHLSNVFSSFSFVAAWPPRCVSLSSPSPPNPPDATTRQRQLFSFPHMMENKEAERAANQRSWPFCLGGAIFGGHALFISSHFFLELTVHSHHSSIHNVADNCIVWAGAKFGVLINRALTPALLVLAVWFVCVTRRSRLPPAPPTMVCN